MKSLFNNDINQSYTQEAMEIEHECYLALKPIMQKWYQQGYSSREIEYLMSTAIFDIAIGARLSKIKGWK